MQVAHTTCHIPARLSAIPEENALDLTSFTDGNENAVKRTRRDFQCPNCQANYTEQRSLDRHQRESVGCSSNPRHVSRYPCPHCTRTFKRTEGVRRHITEKHNGMRRPPPRKRLPPTPLTTPPTAANLSVLVRQDETPFQGGLSTAGSLALSKEVFEVEHLVPQHVPGWTETWPGTTLLPDWQSADDTQMIGSCADAALCDDTVWLRDVEAFADDRRQHSPEQPPSCHGTESFHKKHPSFWDLSKPSRSDLEKAGVLRRRPKHRAQRPCPICLIPFGETLLDIQAHLRIHADEYFGRHWCEACMIGFQHAEDLTKHLRSARKGHCGFHFPHTKCCNGHHPPDPSQVFSDNDQLKLLFRLQHWEQSQLQAYWDRVNDLPAEHTLLSMMRRWTLNDVARLSKVSVGSTQTSTSARSTPAYIDYFKRLDMVSLRRTARQRLTDAVRGLDTALVKAMQDRDFDRILQLIMLGGNMSKLGGFRCQITQAVEACDAAMLSTLLTAERLQPAKDNSLPVGTPPDKEGRYEVEPTPDVLYASMLSNISLFVDVNEPTLKYRHELIRAVDQGSFDCVAALLANGIRADADVVLAAGARHHSHIVDMLLEDVLRHNSAQACSILESAIRERQYGIVSSLINEPYCAGTVARLGTVSLLRAVQDGDMLMMKTLLRGPLHVDAVNEADGRTALIVAARTGRLDLVTFLLKAGADANKHTQDGHFALLIAIEADNNAMFEELRAHGADLVPHHNEVVLNAFVAATHDRLSEIIYMRNRDDEPLNDFLAYVLNLALRERETNLVEQLTDAGIYVCSGQKPPPVVLIKQLISATPLQLAAYQHDDQDRRRARLWDVASKAWKF